MVTTAGSDRLSPSGSPVWLGNTKHNRGGPENKNSLCTECFHGAWRYSVTHVLGKHCSCTIHSRLERSGVLRVGGGLGREGVGVWSVLLCLAKGHKFSYLVATQKVSP